MENLTQSISTSCKKGKSKTFVYQTPIVYINGKAKIVSRYVMEHHLGRKLESTELVHHINHNTFDNRIENLQIVSRAEHKRLHPEIGVSTRLQKIWYLDEKEILRLYNIHKSSYKIAKIIGCNEVTIRRVIYKVSGKTLTEFKKMESG